MASGLNFMTVVALGLSDVFETTPTGAGERILAKLF